MTNDSKRRITRTALPAPSRIESAACCATNIHRTRKPTRDERTNAQYPDQDGGVQKKIFQPLRILHSSRTIRLPAFISGLKRYVKLGARMSGPQIRFDLRICLSSPARM